MKKLRFLLAENLPVERAMLRARLLQLFDPDAIDEVFSLDDAVACAGRGYDLLLIDVELPGMDFAGGLTRLQSAFAETPIALVAGVTRAAQVRAAQQLGVRGFFPKTLSPQAFAATVRLLVAGGTYLPATAEPQAEEEDRARSCWLDLLLEEERRLLRCVARGMTNRDIARELCCDEAHVPVALGALCRKAGARTRSELAARAALAGIAP